MRRLWVACALALVAVLRAYTVASAHVTLVSSEPAAGSRLDAVPSRIRLQFSETLDASLARISIVSPNSTQASLRATSDPANAYALLANAEVKGTGVFRINWRVVSDDGHPVTGSFSFTVGPTDAKLPEPTVAPQHSESSTPSLANLPVVPAVLRGFGVGALAALAGLLAFSLRAPSTSAQSRVTMLLAAFAPLLFIAHLGAWLYYTAPDHRVTGVWMSSIFGSTVGRIELWRSICSLMPLWALWLARRPRLAFALAIPALLLSSAVGHSAAFHPMWSIPLKAVHLFALALWLGGLLWLSTRDRTDAPSFARATLRVSSVALVGVIAIAASGIARSLLILPSVSSIRSAYGGVLFAKLAGLAVLIGFGAYHRYRVMPRIFSGAGKNTAESFASSLHREIAVLWCVALLGGLLSYIAPPS